MPDPKVQKRHAEGVRLAPLSIDAVPADWSTVQYTITIVPHPDLPSVPILKFVEGSGGGSTATYAWLYLTAIDPSGNVTLLPDDSGNPIPVYAPI